MKLIGLVILIITTSGALRAQQDEFKLDTLVFNNGIKFPVTLMIEGIELKEGAIINFIDDSGDDDSMPLANLKQIIRSDGVILYPTSGNSTVEVEDPCSSALSSKLILDIYEAASIQKEAIVEKIKLKEATNFKANETLTKTFSEKFYAAIYDDIALLTCSNSSVDATLFIYLDADANFLKLEDSVHSVKNTSFYQKIKSTSVLPFLKNHSFSANETTLINKNSFAALKSSFSEKIEAFGCQQKDFEDVFSILEEDLKSYDTVQVATATIYEVRLNYEFSSETQGWTYHKSKNRIALTDDKKVMPGTPETRKAFMGKIPNKNKNAYSVQLCNYEILNEPKMASVNKVEKKKNKWVKIGGAVFYHVNSRVAADEHLYDLSNQYFYNFYAIYQRVGVYYGSVYINEPMYVNRVYDFEVSSLKSKEGGMYFGLTNSLFLKFGFASIKGDLHEYSGGLVDAFSAVNRPLNQLGFSTGLAYILPGIHVELGYNQLFKSTYVGAGLNIPIKVK
ncbi:MAG: hypothetical protein GQ574_24305 [Crocinitomix sp.]|nr:hypothetical protein [Crocinitomix sp.]